MKIIFQFIFCLYFVRTVYPQQNNEPSGKILCGAGFITNIHDVGANLNFEYFVKNKFSVGLRNILMDAKNRSSSYQTEISGVLSNHNSTGISGYNFFSALTGTVYLPVPSYEKFKFYCGLGVAYNQYESKNSFRNTNPFSTYNVTYSHRLFSGVLIPGGHYKMKRGMIIVEFPFFVSPKIKEFYQVSNLVGNVSYSNQGSIVTSVSLLYTSAGYAIEF